jgi:starch synthase (maltosyl-transferring)
MDARIVIDCVRPTTLTGQYPAKASEGERVPVSADIFKDGHDALGARVRWRKRGGDSWNEAPLHKVINDEWHGSLVCDAIGAHEFVVEAWTDTYSTWRHKLEVKLSAGQDVSLELAEGMALFEQRKSEAKDSATRGRLDQVAHMLSNDSLDYASRAASAATSDVASLMTGPSAKDDVSSSAVKALWIDRKVALFGAWYEFFPRSVGGLKGSADHLDYVADMGFDVAYLPPIHPIGVAYRKGKNNTLDAGRDDVGSPWAIGGPEGGHTDIHPDLGTLSDFRALVAKAKGLGIEIALDYALQCSPDHPWVHKHPEWFNRRSDGTIAYAENPPKKYQDIYPINFWPDAEKDRQALWSACKEILDFWIDQGVSIFRVDNPHTKPLALWAWMIPAIQAEHPEVIFLSEAFTRPKMMAKLAEVGFSQSYTYFTWRRAKWELTEYGNEVAHATTADYMRPNFWPNTPDILAHPLRNAPMSAFRMRSVLAATMAPSYGVYSGFELGENMPQSEMNEEYFHSEKYEIKTRNFKTASSLASWFARLNKIRREHPAFAELRNITFHNADNENVICYSKRSSIGSDTVLVVVNLDPYNVAEATLNLNMESLGLGWDQPFEVFDELSQQTFHWWGSHSYVRLEPDQPAHVLHVRTT